MALTITDGIITFVTLVALLALSPIFFEFATIVDGEADPLSGLVLSLVVPLFFVAILISVGVSARRRV
jgi:hypothetical protein